MLHLTSKVYGPTFREMCFVDCSWLALVYMHFTFENIDGAFSITIQDDNNYTLC